MTGRDDALKALEDRDWTGATVERRPRQVMVVQSVRLPADLSEWINDEATRHGVNPSVMIRQLLEAARREANADEVVTIRRSDLRRAIDAVVHSAA